MSHEHDEATGQDEPLAATEGTGPLLQRDYWGVLEGCRLEPAGVAELVARRFQDFAPPELVQFTAEIGGRALQVGDELAVKIRGAGTFGVRVAHQDPLSMTLATLPGHPEAGRITFGCYRAADGAAVFHIRSRARSSSMTRYLGFRAAGEAMQTETWGGFIDRVAAVAGEGVRGVIHVETTHMEDVPGDAPGAPAEPTFRAEEA